MYNGNALKIGLFGANCSSGRSATKVPERWSASWPDCLALARLADAAGLDFMLPIAVLAARRHAVNRHSSIMIGISVGALVIAGLSTSRPDRIMHAVAFGD
jgi:predicted alpha/beta hydrolase